ncbi:SRPBCC domain-containing protein [Olivibacter sp. CPCC 100613]|uniref:SRPBCC domain-containing protein n=1 Tax=Olivibacter sp. CPCC 100613 TaxID=3079931 RepID=UPI002FF9C5C8
MENTNNREMKMTRTVKAPIDLVWKVWTEPEYIVQWWGPNDHTTTIHEMDFTEGGEWKLTLHNQANGQDFVNRSVFKEIIPLKKIVFEHFNPHFIATILFEDKGDETWIEWSSLFDTEEMIATVINVFNAKEGQAQNFERLEHYLEQLKNGTHES